MLGGHDGGLAGDNGRLSGYWIGLAGDGAERICLGQVLSGRVALDGRVRSGGAEIGKRDLTYLCGDSAVGEGEC